MIGAIKKLVAVALVVIGAFALSAFMFAQGSDTPPADTDPDTPPADTDPAVEEVKFIGDPPGNEQTGEWEGEYEFEG